VFIVTASFSAFAYIWLLIILVGTSPDEIEVWEGVMTLVWYVNIARTLSSALYSNRFVLLILFAYAADKNLIERIRARHHRRSQALADGHDVEKVQDESVQPLQMGRLDSHGHAESSMHEMERQIRLQYPGVEAIVLAKMLAYRIKAAEPHSRMWYRIQVCSNHGV
jgi:solute carrier family 8 (sodium/calcium exchanger)